MKLWHCSSQRPPGRAVSSSRVSLFRQFALRGALTSSAAAQCVAAAVWGRNVQEAGMAGTTPHVEHATLTLARMRARGQLAELRAADLCFTPEEAAEFLDTSMGLFLAEGQVAALVARTEGWAAGLQLAGLALRDRPDPAAFVTAFAGSHRLVADYLTAEVLDGLPVSLRRFLLA